MRELILIVFLCNFYFSLCAQQLKLLVPLDSIHYCSEQLLPYLNPKTNLFISGETHGINEVNDAKIFHLFSFFQKNSGVQTIMWEAGLAYNYYVQQYLQSGDTSLLSLLTVNNNLHTKQFFSNLHALNASLPNGQKINSIGIDLDFWDNYEYSLNCLKYILAKHYVNPSQLPSVGYLQQLKPSGQSTFTKQLDTLNKLVKIDSIALKASLGDCFNTFYNLCYRLRISAGIMNKRFFAFDREPLLTKHFQEEVVDTRLNVFSQFGDAHLPCNKFYNPFTERIIQKNPNYKITPINSVYINCYSNYGSIVKYSHSTFINPLKKFKSLRKKLSEQKGIWLAVIEQKSGAIEWVVIASNYK